MKINILGVQIDNLTKPEVLKRVEQFLSDNRQHYIVTPNPEIVIAGQKDKELLEILNRADIAVPDGIGLIFASRYLKKRLSERITGVDLMLDICKFAEQKNYSVYLLGAAWGLSKPNEVIVALNKRYPNLKIKGRAIEKFYLINKTHKPLLSQLDQKQLSEEKDNLSKILKEINTAKPDILFVALGVSFQEKFIANNLKNIPSVKIAMGVGGAFDFIAGKVKRAPRWMQKIGLEWLWRLFMQPWRWKRILTATVKFSWEVITKGKK